MPDGSQIDNIVDTFSRCQQPFSLKFHKADKLSQKVMGTRDVFNKLTNLTGLEFSMLNKKRLESLLVLNFSAGSDLQRVEGPLSIKFSDSLVATSLTRLDVLSMLADKAKDWPKLPNLEFYAGRGFSKIPIFEETPKLTTLIIRRTDVDWLVQQRLNKLTNLKVLKICEPCSFVHDLDLDLPNLEEFDVMAPKMRPAYCNSTRLTRLKTKILVQGFTKHTTLKSLTIQPGKLDRTNDNDLIGLKEFPQLEEFCLNGQEEEQQNIEVTGKIFQFMNPKTLTKLSVDLKSKEIDEISSFTNLRELNLVLRQTIMFIDFLSNLSKLTKLSIGGIKTPELDWLNRLTNLRALYLDFKSLQNSNEVPLDLAELTNLRTLVITPRTNKVIHSLNKLKKLERLEFPLTNENIFHDQWLALTSLSFRQAVGTEHISELTRLRELDCIVITNDEIVQLTSLQKLTRFICRSTTANSMFLTHLTSLQSVAFSGNVSPADWATVQPWSYYNAYPDVIRKLPNFIEGPKDQANTLPLYALYD